MSPERIDTLARLMILDLLLESSERYWLKRAADFAKVGTPAPKTATTRRDRRDRRDRRV